MERDVFASLPRGTARPRLGDLPPDARRREQRRVLRVLAAQGNALFRSPLLIDVGLLLPRRARGLVIRL